MKSIQFIFTIVIFTLVSCNTSESLDKYYVTHQEKQGFMAVDVPTSILEIDTNSLTQDQKEAYQSIAKLNFLGFKKSEANRATFTTEKQKVKKILTNTKYKSLVRFHRLAYHERRWKSHRCLLFSCPSSFAQHENTEGRRGSGHKGRIREGVASSA